MTEAHLSARQELGTLSRPASGAVTETAKHTEASAQGSVRPIRVSVVIPAYNASATLAQCLEAVESSGYPHYECIVVDDSSTDDTREIARRFSAQVVPLEGGPSGPAYARNRGVQVATGDVVFFVDADVVIGPDVISKMAATFQSHGEVDAVFGSYDDSPGAGDFSSQFKNLFHHFVHQQGRERAVTFWSGCGAVRWDVFLEVGGFDEERYPRPSIEDIELGYRMTAAGHRIVLDKDVQVKHLKHWTLRGIIKTDILDRAVPWTQLIIQERELPNDLNLGLSQRASALLLCVLLLHLGITSLFHNIIVLPLLAGAFFVLVGYWNWTEGTPPLSGMSGRAEAAMYVLTGAIIALSLYFGRPLMLIPVSLLLIGMIAGRRFGRLGRVWRHLLFVAVVLGSVGAFAVLVVDFTIWLLTPLLGLIATIVVLNLRFYAFFMRKRGVTFALAVIPFHLLYFLYSTATFALVTGLHTWNTSVRRHT